MNRPETPLVHRRDVIRLVPLALMGTVFAGFARALTACTTETVTTSAREKSAPLPAGDDNEATDADEFVDGKSAIPVNAGEGTPKVPNPTWEGRVKQLESEQARLFGAVFSQAAPGVFRGKEKTHVPQATVAKENNLTKVTVLVEHVMGKNTLDAGSAAPVVDSGGGGGGGLDASADGSTDAGRIVTNTPDAARPPEHYITTIYLRAMVDGKDTVVGLWEFASTDAAPPIVKFTMPAGVTSIVAYEWCTLHGLWQTDPLAV